MAAYTSTIPGLQNYYRPIVRRRLSMTTQARVATVASRVSPPAVLVVPVRWGQNYALLPIIPPGS